MGDKLSISDPLILRKSLAVNIAKLRLWLSLAVDFDGATPPPLPNLDFKIECGDSLTAPNPQEMPDLFRRLLVQSADRLADLKGKFLQTYRDEKKWLADRIKREESKLRESLHEQLEPGSVDWRVAFAEVFKNGGFDIVLANPPYVDSEQMVRTSPEYRAKIADKYSVAKGNWDLYVPFWQRSVQLLSRHGQAALITPNKWLSIAYGKELRGYLRGMVTCIADYTRFRAFENVGVSSIVTLICRGGRDSVRVMHFSDGHRLLCEFNVPSGLTETFQDWGFLLSENLGLITRNVEENEKLRAYCDLEAAFTVSEAYELSEILQESHHPKKTEFRFVNTGTIEPYTTLWGKKSTTYLKTKYLHPVVDRLAFKRRFPRRFQQMSSPKIIITGIRHFEAFLDRQGDWIAGKSTVVLRNFAPRVSPEVLLALLNSKMARFFLNECYGSLGMDGGINFTPAIIGSIPVPKIGESEMRKLHQLILRTLDCVTASDPTEYLELQQEIDAILFKSFGLTENEVKLIDERVRNSGKRRQRNA